jgi:hypothetical protein
MYGVATLISGNRAARSAIFFYALALHAAVFLVLARWVGGVWGGGPACCVCAGGIRGR